MRKISQGEPPYDFPPIPGVAITRGMFGGGGAAGPAPPPPKFDLKNVYMYIFSIFLKIFLNFRHIYFCLNTWAPPNYNFCTRPWWPRSEYSITQYHPISKSVIQNMWYCRNFASGWDEIEFFPQGWPLTEVRPYTLSSSSYSPWCLAHKMWFQRTENAVYRIWNH